MAVASFQRRIVSFPAMSARVLMIVLFLATPAFSQVRKMLPKYEGRYYIIHTDLTGDDLREADLRMTGMAEEYLNRTRSFAGELHGKMPFFLFRNESDYFAAGGNKESAGFFDPRNNTLNAIAGEHADATTWHTVQHEGFHQFARAVIGGELPTWVNEGLAEYFAEAVFTGNGFVSGVIPQKRMERVKKEITSRKFESVKDLMLLTHAEWNQGLTVANYDQAWSMVQFLAHAENGKYQTAFGNFMRAVGRGRPWTLSWQDQFGSGEGFEDRWKAYWLALPPNPTIDLYAQAATQTLTGVLGRATAERQKFASIDDLLTAMQEGGPKFQADRWLPPSLLIQAADDVRTLRELGDRFTLVQTASGKLPAVMCFTKAGMNLTGRFALRGGNVGNVTVQAVPRGANSPAGAARPVQR